MRGTVSLACAPHTLYHCSGFQFRPEGRVHFLCSAKENEPKERRTRRLAPRHTCRGVPCAPRKNRRAPNSPISLRSLRARTWGALLELQARLAVLPAVLGCTDGANPLYPTSRWRSRASQGFWERVSPLFELAGGVSGLLVGRTPKSPRSTGHPRSGQAVGRLSLWVLSLGRARESTSPDWAKPVPALVQHGAQRAL